MKAQPIGIIVIIVGILMLIYTGFTYKTSEKVVDLGPVEINKTTNHPVQWSPILGVVLVLGGIVIIVKTKKGGI